MSSQTNKKICKNSSLFSSEEKRNLIIYIFGIVVYKFGLEAYNGSIITLATNRFDQDALESNRTAHTFEKVGYVAGLNQALQCFGSMLISPLIKRYPTRTILSIAIFIFGSFTAVLIILDSATGGRIKPKDFNSTNKNDFSYYGDYQSNWIILIYGLTGIVYGTVESIHRVIPADIVGNHVEKLQRFDALVHTFYAISGAVGAFVTGLVLIPKLGNNQAFLITPILFTVAGLCWLFLSLRKKKKTKKKRIQIEEQKKKSKKNFVKTVLNKLISYSSSIVIGAKIILTNRKYIWLFSCYTLSLYAHRYLEDGISPQIARRYLTNSAWSEIIIGGSNFGELLGSVFILIFARRSRTPLPWLRLSSILLLIVRYVPFCQPSIIRSRYASFIALSFIPISFGWAAGDVSLGAYIQSSISQLETENKQVSPLGAVMAFLYSSYIILYAILNPLLGKYIDSIYNSQATVRPALLYTAAVQLSIISAIVFLSTFIPKGAFAFNPKLLQSQYDENQQSTQTSQTNEQNSDVDLNTYF